MIVPIIILWDLNFFIKDVFYSFHENDIVL